MQVARKCLDLRVSVLRKPCLPDQSAPEVICPVAIIAEPASRGSRLLSACQELCLLEIAGLRSVLPASVGLPNGVDLYSTWHRS